MKGLKALYMVVDEVWRMGEKDWIQYLSSSSKTSLLTETGLSGKCGEINQEIPGGENAGGSNSPMKNLSDEASHQK